MEICSLKTEYAINPLGIDILQPRLSWRLDSEEEGAAQSAYRIIVASSPELLEKDQGDLWDSGRVISNESINITYGGEALSSEQYCYWKVQVWDHRQRVSAWSDIAFWSMGLLQADEWKAQWIDMQREEQPELLPGSYLRKEFELNKPVRRATVYASALGLYELHLNGKRINDLFTPGWTDYKQRVQYQTYDVTDVLNQGGNAIAMLLGTGWYSGTVGMSGTRWYGDRPYAMSQLHIEYDDGTKEAIVSNEQWKAANGPLIYSDIIMGETYDATKTLSGWSEYGFDDSAWKAPDVMPPYEGELVSQWDPPVQVTQIMKPMSITKTSHNTYIYDMGQNMVGWVELKVKGPKGTKVTLSYAEMQKDDGTLYIENLRDAVQKDHYILSGDEQGESYEPHFTFHGFRYVELIGYPGEPTLESITGKVVHSATPETGTFVTSDDMINKLYSNIHWGQRGNFLSIPTDCPQRDERLGWTGDAQIFFRTASYNMDVSRFFNKYMIDVTDAQLPSGAFPDVAPDGGWIWFKTTKKKNRWLAPDNAGWGDAGVIIPWTMYLVYKDKRLLEQQYESMVRWIDYLKEGSTDLIRPDYGDYGDWLSINSVSPNTVVATAYFAYSTKLMAQIAEVLDKKEDAAQFRDLFERICAAFNHKFVDEEGRIEGNSQTVYILALRFGLLDERRQAQAIRHLVDDIKAFDTHLSTGFLGVGHVLPVLSEYGFNELAYQLLRQESFPSWLYSVKQGATTIWERWDGWTEEKGFGPKGTNSFNHYALGSVGEWMYRYMAGIDTSQDQPGYKHTLIRPRIGGGLSYVRASYESLYGKIASAWELKGEKGQLEVTIPANTTAEIYIPAAIEGRKTKSVQASDGIVMSGKSGAGDLIYPVGSGTYRFEFALD